MNTVRIIKSDAPTYYTNAGRYGYPCHKQSDCHNVKSHWTAEEAAVLIGLDLDGIKLTYDKETTLNLKLIGETYFDKPLKEMGKAVDELPTFTAYLRYHIQEILKGQEGKDEPMCDPTCLLYDGRLCDVAYKCEIRKAWKAEIAKRRE